MKHIPKKSLGQHFLVSQKALRDIVTASTIRPDDTILEIGPGTGVLTKELLKYAEKVIAIEKDTSLIPTLQETFAQEIAQGTFEIIHQDILLFDPQTIQKMSPRYKLVANIPYYITGAIIQKFLDTRFQPTHMVLLVQKEVAERIVAKDNKQSILSCIVHAYCTPRIISKVPKGAFVPPPTVDSAIISFSDISRQAFDTDHHESLFIEIVKQAFAHKRKYALSNISEIYDKDLIRDIWHEHNLDFKIRAENISVTTWIAIARSLARFE